MDINLIRSSITLALFILFILLIFKVFSKKSKLHFDEAAHLPFVDGDERSEQINQENTKVKNHE